MGIFFGTDGIRGIVNKELTSELAYKCGNALGSSKTNPTIIIGGDTRKSRTFLTTAVASGAMSAGANIIDVGICPTAGIAYITKKIKADYGVVISASHNPEQYNGIKIFDCDGVKLNEDEEVKLERKFIQQTNIDYNNVGCYNQNFYLVEVYKKYLISCCNHDLNGLKIVLDCSNGASCDIAKSVFAELGAEVISTYCDKDAIINDCCGSLYPQILSNLVKENNADMGFAFDGDADRVIACDENGNILDGDIIIYILSNYLKEQGKLYKNSVVGTIYTNVGIEKELMKKGINLIRTDVGDKYVIAKIEEQELSLGGEKSGHIIFRQLSTTGDGILTAIKIAELVKYYGKNLSIISKIELYPQINIDCVVKDKNSIINNEKLKIEINTQEKILGEGARIIVRASGTEPKIRIMCEGKDYDKCLASVKHIEHTINQLNELY